MPTELPTLPSNWSSLTNPQKLAYLAKLLGPVAIPIVLRLFNRLAHRPSAAGRSAKNYVVSSEVANFVLRGARANDEVARQIMPKDRIMRALLRAAPSQEPEKEELRTVVTGRLRSMFRSLASFAKDRDQASRKIADQNGWSLDIQYEIANRFPLRPDESSAFLQVLQIDLQTALGRGQELRAAWGELGIEKKQELVMKINPSWTRTTDLSRLSSVKPERLRQ